MRAARSEARPAAGAAPPPQLPPVPHAQPDDAGVLLQRLLNFDRECVSALIVLVNSHGCKRALAAGACTAGCMGDEGTVGGHCADEPTLAGLIDIDPEAAGKL